MAGSTYPKSVEARLRKARDYSEYQCILTQWRKKEKKRKEVTARALQAKRPRRPISCSIKAFSALVRNRDEFAEYRKSRRNLWVTFRLQDPLPSWPCCYVIYTYGKVAYIGETESLQVRLYKHKIGILSEIPPDEVVIKAKLPRRYGEWAMTERRLIKRLQPPLNRKGVTSRAHGF